MYKKIIKRVLDLIVSITCIVIFSPLFLIISLMIKIDSKGPLIFKQKRIGIDKKYFNILKFRTMRIDTPKDVPTHLFHNPENYITTVGKFLRKTSLDELPQLFNIFKGEMSFIGPRPALWNQDDLIIERDKYGVNEILPGLSGWAQINGRDEISIMEKAKFDGEYVKNLSFLFDLKCLLLTIPSVINSKGISDSNKQNNSN